MNKLLSAYEIAEILNVTSTTIYNWVAKGLPYKEERTGLKIVKMFDLKEVEKWIRERS